MAGEGAQAAVEGLERELAVLVESPVEEPIIPLSLFGNRTVVLAVVASVAVGSRCSVRRCSSPSTCRSGVARAPPGPAC